MNRQRFSMYLGLAIVTAHVLLSFYFMFIFEPLEYVAIEEISRPLTLAYVSAIVLWFFQHDGLIVSQRQVGVPLVGWSFLSLAQ